MPELPIQTIVQILLFLLVPFLWGYCAVRLRVPTVIGYIVAGFFLALIKTADVSSVVSFFANIGLLLLLFTLGLELDLSTLRRHGKAVIVAGLLQVALTTLGTLFLLAFLQFGLTTSLLLGFALSLSSTAVVSKIIQERGDEHTLPGQLAIGILILQDIIAIPGILIISSYSPNLTKPDLLIAVSASVLKSIGILGLMYVFGERIIPRVFEKLGKVSRELLNLFTIVFIFALVGIFRYLGLSTGLASFSAGLLIGQTAQHHHIFSQIRPLRDIFVILFFVFLGVSTNLNLLANQWVSIVMFSLCLVLLKIVVMTLVLTKMKYNSKTVFSVGLFLSQVGEFAFILLREGHTNGLLSAEAMAFGTGVSLMTLLISPFLIQHHLFLYMQTRKIIKNHIPVLEEFIAYRIDREGSVAGSITTGHTDHVILCGYGRVGSYVGRALTLSNIPYCAIDYNQHVVQKERLAGVDIIYGDPTSHDILDIAGVKEAKAIIIALPDNFSQELVVLSARRKNPKILIFARVRQKDEQLRLKSLGADVVIQPEFEAALSIVKKVMRAKHMNDEDIQGKIKRLKIEHGMA